MSLSTRGMAVETFAPMLESLSVILDKAREHADETGIDLPNARLAPDMFTLTQQVQSACHNARDGVARLCGGAVSTPEPLEPSLAAMRARIAVTIAFARAADTADFAGAETRDCSIPLPGGLGAIELDGEAFLRAWALPHFYFHVVTAYDILRHNGVSLGKRDYLGHLAAHIRPAAAPAG